MLNFLWKKTSKKSSSSNGEPPLMKASPVHGSFENVQRFKQKPSRPRSMFVEEADGRPNICHPLQVSASTSLDEHRFTDVCVSPRRSSDLPGKNAPKNKSESQLNYLADEPAKYYNSPKISSRYQPSGRSSGHNRSHSVFINIPQVSSDMKAETEITPRLYKKNPSIGNKIMPLHGVLVNVSFDGSTTGSGVSDGQSSQWSFCEDADSNPVPPPRKRRSRPQEASSETSSLSSTDPAEISKLTSKKDCVDERERSENGRVSALREPDPLEFTLNLPPGFSDLGLDLLAVEFSAMELTSEPKTQNLETPEQCAAAEQLCVLKLERMHDPEIISTRDDLRSNHNSVSFSSNGMKQINFRYDELPQTKLRSETIVQSIFAKGKRCHDTVLNSESTDSGERLTGSAVGANTTKGKYCDQNHLVLQKTLPEFQLSTKNGFTKISEYQDTLIQRIAEKQTPWDHGSSKEAVFYAPETEWTVGFCSGGRIQGDCGNGTQPDVLIGTQLKVLSSSLTSLPSDSSDQSIDAVQVSDKVDCRLSNEEEEEEQGHDLVVVHQLQGSPSKIVIKIGDTSTSQDVIEKILRQEKLPADWHLYKLCSKTFDPKVSNAVDDFVELDWRDYPLKHLKQKHPNGNIQFELHPQQRIQIRVTCDAGLERPKTVILGISCEETCGNVVDMATQKFSLKSAAKFCLIQVDRNVTGCLMKRVPESQIIAQLHTDYFLLCEKKYLADASDVYDRSFETSARIKSCSRSTYSTCSPATVELDRLERKVVDLKRKLIECQKLCQQKLKNQQNQLDCYRAIAFCTDPATKVMLLEAELQRLTRVMEEQDRQLQMHRDLSKMSSHSEDERDKIEDKLIATEKSLSAIHKERTELCMLLQVTRTEELETSEKHASKKVTPPLYSVCHEYQGNGLYGFQVDRSNRAGQEYLPFKKGVNLVGNHQNDGGFNLVKGDRILEINGQPIRHLNERELLSIVGEMADNLHIVVLREETSTKDIYVL